LQSLDIKVVRPNASVDTANPDALQKLPKPPMCPRDHMIMLGQTLLETISVDQSDCVPNANCFMDLFDHVRQQGNCVESIAEPAVCAAMIYQLPNAIFFGAETNSNASNIKHIINQYRPNMQMIPFYNYGHIDGWFAPVGPNLIISSTDTARQQFLELFFSTFFPESEIIYLPPSLGSDYSFLQWQKRSQDRWLISGQENNADLAGFIDKYFDHWMGKISETVFEVNMIIVDEKNVIVSNYNDTIFRKFDQLGIMAHVCEFRHEKFWDAGLSCITCELHRER
jgi:hypothetical protein